MNQIERVPSISAQDLYQRYQGGEAVEVIDVRVAAAYAEAHVPMAQSWPLERLDPRAVLAARPSSADEPLYVICQLGGRSAEACKRLIESGFTSVVNVEGGTEAWELAGLPVVRERRGVELRRQVQLVAGALIVLGSTLSLLWHPLFTALSCFIGAGLIYTGATGSCALGSFLARMPWNQDRDITTAARSLAPVTSKRRRGSWREA